jgi:hypothetical protein
LTAIVVEYARFVEVRQRRARVAEELIETRPGTPVRVSRPAVDDQAVELSVSRTEASITRGDVDVR